MKMLQTLSTSLVRWTILAGIGGAFVLATAGDASAQVDARQIQRIQQQQQRQVQQQQRQLQQMRQAMQRVQQAQQRRTVDALKQQGIETPEQLRAAQEQAHYQSLSPGEKRRYDREKQRLERLAKREADRIARLQGIANRSRSQDPPAVVP